MVPWAWGPERLAVPPIKRKTGMPGLEARLEALVPTLLLWILLENEGKVGALVIFPDGDRFTWVTQLHSWVVRPISIHTVCVHIWSI